jgi:hypothetical protein
MNISPQSNGRAYDINMLLQCIAPNLRARPIFSPPSLPPPAAPPPAAGRWRRGRGGGCCVALSNFLCPHGAPAWKYVHGAICAPGHAPCTQTAARLAKRLPLPRPLSFLPHLTMPPPPHHASACARACTQQDKRRWHLHALASHALQFSFHPVHTRPAAPFSKSFSVRGRFF